MESSTIISQQMKSGAVKPLMSLRLTGGRVAFGAKQGTRADVVIRRGRIAAITPHSANSRKIDSASRAVRECVVDLSGYLLLPGLINAHDHLEFNLFPRLGDGPYQNSEAWAKDVYRPGRAPVRDHLLVPKANRLWWGVLKNLLSGVTTVCHHNAPISQSLSRLFPVRLVDRYGWAHSLAFGGDIRGAFAKTPSSWPFIIHLAEGTDKRSRDEIFRLDGMGALDERTVVVHGVGLDEAGHELVEQRRAGLVCCPTSNVFTLGRTLEKSQITRHFKVALGSDSALTARGGLLDEIEFAAREWQLSPASIWALVTHSAARLLRLKQGEGAIRPGAVADLIAVRGTGAKPCENLINLTPERVELVLVGGRPKLLSAPMANRWPASTTRSMEVLRTGDIERLVAAPVGKLFRETSQHLGKEIFLAGKMVTR